MSSILAYLDPGSGSLVIQAVIATLLAVPFFFRQQIARAARSMRRGLDPASTAPDKATPNQPNDA